MLNVFVSGIFGVIVGDAAGVPYEFKERDSFQCDDMVGWGTHLLPPGTWSDDSSMTLATMESIVRRGRIDTADIMGNFDAWLSRAEFTPYDDVFDVGNATYKAICRYQQGTEPELCGGTGERDNGNGALMRILPLAFVNCSEEEIFAVCSLTHGHLTSKLCCLYYVYVARNIMLGYNKVEALQFAWQKLADYCHDMPPEIQTVNGAWNWQRGEVQSSGYVIHTLQAALWCFYNTASYRECILTAVNLGDDTDTVAAVAGGLAGLYYCLNGKDESEQIPGEWIAKIARREYIVGLCNKFAALING